MTAAFVVTLIPHRVLMMKCIAIEEFLNLNAIKIVVVKGASIIKLTRRSQTRNGAHAVPKLVVI